MIKWFCDICKQEILEHPVKVCAYRVTKNRDRASVGYGVTSDIGEAWCDKECADRLEQAIHEVFRKVV